MSEDPRKSNPHAILCSVIISHWHLGLGMIAEFLKDIQHGDELEFVTLFPEPVLFPEILTVLTFRSPVQSCFPFLLPI